jgi:Rad3-related DNA helicase
MAIEQENNRKRPQIRLSVRNFVEFLLREGDIDDRRGSKDSVTAMQEGSRIHRKIQRKMGSSYQSEYPLKYVMTYETYDFALEGRADGIIDDGEMEIPMVDEIKGIYQDVLAMEEPIPVHLAQAKCYAYIYAAQNHFQKIDVQMTYCNLDTEEIQRMVFHYSFEELEDWFLGLCQEYKKWADFQIQSREERNLSIKDLKFPFAYRKGQKKLAGAVYETIRQKELLYIQAPTGSGKTIATIYPAVKAVGEELGEKIFYLTAKTITRTVAKDTFALLLENGLKSHVLEITAKDRICPLEERACNPEQCPYAKGFFDRINDALFEILQERQLFTREFIEEMGEKYQLCPFELSLEMATWMDDIICDYNYVFDPNVYLKRFFAEGTRGGYIFLVDEVHNLVDRAREMYSETLVKEDVLKVKKWAKNYSKRLEKALEKTNRILLQMKKECERLLYLQDVDELLFSLLNVGNAFEKLFEDHPGLVLPDEERDFYFAMRNFLNLSEGLDENYKLYADYDQEQNFRVHMFCVNPRARLQQCLNRAEATVYFSATLLPIQYYQRLLAEKDNPYAIYAESSFDPKKQQVLIGSDVSSKYKRRTNSEYKKYADYIEKIVSCKKGNYMVFFPSYQFMDRVQEYMNCKNYILIKQQRNMTEADRDAFLMEFEKEREESLVSLCVMGGIFAEGIDLTEDRLIGAIIVGTGLPQVSLEKEVLQNYFDDTFGEGFLYAYLYPGMNKVMQSAGRVIRTVDDVGMIALLDDRFLNRDYTNTFPLEWKGAQVCSLDTVEQTLRPFWESFT